MTEKQVNTAALIAALQACLDTPAGDRQVTVDVGDGAAAARCAAMLTDIKVEKVHAVESLVVLGTETHGFSWE